jgi:hypothetical protein
MIAIGAIDKSAVRIYLPGFRLRGTPFGTGLTERVDA